MSMAIHECRIGTLVYLKGYREFVGHIVGFEFSASQRCSIPVVEWPRFSSEYEEEFAKAEYPGIPWIQLGYERSTVHPDNLFQV